MGRHLISFDRWSPPYGMRADGIPALTSGTDIVIHDYRRGRYQLVKALFDIVEERTCNSFVS